MFPQNKTTINPKHIAAGIGAIVLFLLIVLTFVFHKAILTEFQKLFGIVAAPGSGGDGGSGNTIGYSLTALGGDCSLPCVPGQPTCTPGQTVSTQVTVNGQALLAVMDGVPAVFSPLITAQGSANPGQSYVYPLAPSSAAAFLSVVRVAIVPSSGGVFFEAAQFNASHPTVASQGPPGFVQYPIASDDGQNFAAFVAESLAPRKDGNQNLGLLLVLNGGPAFFAGKGASPGSSAGAVLAGMRSLGPCPIWSALAATVAAGSATVPLPNPQAYCAAYDFKTNTLTESTGLPNCVANLQGGFNL
jgi:hypothetical protein